MVVKFLFIIVKSGLYTLVSNKKSPEVSVCLRTLNLNPKTEHSKKECCKFSGYFYAKFSVYSI